MLLNRIRLVCLMFALSQLFSRYTWLTVSISNLYDIEKHDYSKFYELRADIYLKNTHTDAKIMII